MLDILTVDQGACRQGEMSPWRTHRLRSLWDMMQLDASAFYKASTRLAETKSYISAMKDNPKSVFNRERRLEPPDRIFMKGRFSAIIEHLEVLGARVTVMAVQDAERECENDYTTWADAENLIEEINNTLRRELNLVTLLALDAQDTELYAPEYPLFGLDFDKQFPSISYEVDEAASCLALDRSTASAFHSIRCLEAGIRALSRCLAISDPTRAANRSWSLLLKALKEAIDDKWPGSNTRLSGDGEFFDNAYAALAAMQNPWRNATMHLDQKYTSSEARHIFEVAKGFMAKIASRMDENGDPKA